MDNLKNNELEIFNKFKKTGDKKHFQELYSSMKPLIYKAAERAAYGSNIPESAHRIYAAQAFLDSLKTFNPNSGASLQTHVYGSVQNKVKRLNYEYQDLGKKPENRAVMVGQFQNAFENLRSDLGREPSAAEIADHMSIPIKQVGHLQKELRKDLGMGDGTDEIGYSGETHEEEFVQFLYFELNPEEKVVYEYITGSYGKPKLSKGKNKIDYPGIAQRMGISESKVRVLHNGIRVKLKKVLHK